MNNKEAKPRRGRPKGKIQRRMFPVMLSENEVSFVKQKGLRNGSASEYIRKLIHKEKSNG